MAPGHEGQGSRPRFDSMRSQSSIGQGWARPASPTFSTTTTGSKINLPPSHALITRKDLRASILCLEELMAAAKAYRNALLAMSSATAAFANAMEACSRVKGCRSSNSAVAGASGLQYLVSNHEQVLADAVYRQFEIPLLEALDHYKLITADRLVMYEKALTEQSAKIRKTESENLKNARRRKRDLQSFRQALADLQRQVDELDGIKAGYHEEVLEGEDEIWDNVLAKIAFVVRSQLDFYEKIAGKASDPILEPLVMSIPDPFDSYGPPKEDGQIFSVLAPLGMLDSTPQSPTPNLTRTGSSPAISTPERSSSPMKGLPFPAAKSATPAQAETTAISARGENGLWDDDVDDGVKDLGTGNGGGSRARRELSVIEESSSAAQRDDGDTGNISANEEGEEDEEDEEDEGKADQIEADTQIEAFEPESVSQTAEDLDDHAPFKQHSGTSDQAVAVETGAEGQGRQQAISPDSTAVQGDQVQTSSPVITITT